MVSNWIDIMRSANGMSALCSCGSWTAPIFPPLILRNGQHFKTTQACSGNDAADVDVDRINPARAAAVPASKRSRNNSCRKAGQRSDFDHALRGENADKRSQEKIIARPDVAGVTGPAPRD